ncbi:MAG: hypothetical protein AVDCRST_MAG19-2652, partial [uncultured Thermomicrobiales bacterium]
GRARFCPGRVRPLADAGRRTVARNSRRAAFHRLCPPAAGSLAHRCRARSI